MLCKVYLLYYVNKHQENNIYIYTSDNQFGFKSGHSTEFSIYTLQEFIEFYKI